MSSKPEDRPKLIGLLVAIVGVFLYVLITLVPKLTGAQTAPPAAPAPPPALAAASVGTPGGNTALTSPSGTASPLPNEESDKVPPAPAHDLFTPPQGDKSQPLPGAPEAQPRRPVKAAAAISGPAPTKPAGLAATPVAPAAPAPPALPPVELKGVILGEPAVAVLSVNGEVVQRQLGDQIAGGLKLVKITEMGIVLQEGKKQIPVIVGHAMSTTIPQAPAVAAEASHQGKM